LRKKFRANRVVNSANPQLMSFSHTAPALLVLAFCLASESAFSQQPRLMLQKRSANKAAYYETGNTITFYVKGNNARFHRQITAIHQDTVAFGNMKVGITEFSALGIDEKTKWWLRFKFSQALLIGGAAYVALDVINSGELSRDTAIIGGSAIALGVIFRIIFPHKIRLDHRTRLRIIEF
jgi:hypothetical protein